MDLRKISEVSKMSHSEQQAITISYHEEYEIYQTYFMLGQNDIDATFSCRTRRILNNIFSLIQLFLSLRRFLLVVRKFVKHSPLAQIFSSASICILRILCCVCRWAKFQFLCFCSVLCWLSDGAVDIPLCVRFRAVLRISVQKIWNILLAELWNKIQKNFFCNNFIKSEKSLNNRSTLPQVWKTRNKWIDKIIKLESIKSCVLSDQLVRISLCVLYNQIDFFAINYEVNTKSFYNLNSASSYQN